MLVDRVETMKAYRDTLRRRVDQATHAALEPVPGGEWDGMEVLRRKVLEEIIHDFAAADPEPLPTSAEVRTPGRVFVEAICPICAIPARVLVEIHAELVVDEDGRTIKAKASSKSSSHVCGQLPLEPGEDADQMSLSELVGPTEPTAIVRTDVPRPEDATLDLPADDRCGAETEIPSSDPEDPEPQRLVCDRKVDHDAVDGDGPIAEDGRDHWAEGGFAWHFEERPVERGIAEATDTPLGLEDDQAGEAGEEHEEDEEDDDDGPG